MRPLGFILYEGPSRIDGTPIVVILNRLTSDSMNAKTGAMAQTFILCQDGHPYDNVRDGGDVAICGNCPHRMRRHADGSIRRTCYVRMDAPASVHKAYKRGRYVKASPRQIRDAVAGHAVRFGTYGDPFAAPLAVWRNIAGACRRWTGYTHQWRDIRQGRDTAAWAGLLMASADTLAERVDATARGWRPFTIVPDVSDVPGDAILCPASPEAGSKTQCADCGLCMGTKLGTRPDTPSIVIPVHGTGKSAFIREAA